MSKAYLGDGLYFINHGFQVELYASDGIDITNRIFLDNEVVDNFLKEIEKAWSLKITVTPANNHSIGD